MTNEKIVIQLSKREIIKYDLNWDNILNKIFTFKNYWKNSLKLFIIYLKMLIIILKRKILIFKIWLFKLIINKVIK